MDGVVPAAGRGERLRPLTDEQPKALVEVSDTPLLTHVFDALYPHVDRYVVVVGYRGEQIRDHYGADYRSTPIRYVAQPERRGLADALRRSADVVDASFLHLNGDNVVRGNIGGVVSTHLSNSADATLVVERVSRERAKRGGVVELQDDSVVGVVEKPEDPPTRLATTGCFAFSPRIFEACRAIQPSDRGEYELPDAIQWLLEDGGTVQTVRFEGWRVNVNTPQDVERARERL